MSAARHLPDCKAPSWALTASLVIWIACEIFMVASSGVEKVRLNFGDYPPKKCSRIAPNTMMTIRKTMGMMAASMSVHHRGMIASI
jgi:hypothetical protein